MLERPPSVATVQTLSLMAIYEGICSGENSIETTWALMGLACKLSQSVSISNLGYMRLKFIIPYSRLAFVREIFHLLPFLLKLIDGHAADRDCARWKLTPAEVQKRRALFWELFITDCWQVNPLYLSSNCDADVDCIFRASQLVDSLHFHFPSSTASYLQILTKQSQKMVRSSLAVSYFTTCPSVSLTFVN